MDKSENACYPALSSFIVLFLTLFFLILRYPFETDYLVVIKVLTTSLFLINAPFNLYLFLEKRRVINFYSYNILIIFLLLFLLVLAGALNIDFLGYPMIVLGSVGFCITFYRYSKYFNFKKLLSVILIFILCLWLSGAVWEGRMLTPLFLEKIISGFYNNPSDLNYGLDNIFHMSIAHMIKTYNMPSTGLDELPYFPYHYGSHFLFANLSRILNTSIPDMYNMGFPLIFLPVFFHLLFIIFKQFTELEGVFAKFGLFFWVLFFSVFIGFLPIDPTGYAFRTGLAWNSIIKSESYLLSLTFFFAFLSIIVLPLLKEKKLNISFLQVVISILLLIIIGFSKISTLFILDAVIGYLYIRYKLYNTLKGNLILFFAIITSLLLAYLLHDTQAPGGSFHFLHFYETFIYSRFHFFVGLYFFWTFVLIAIWLVLYIRKIHVNPILLELQILIALVGFLPGMLLRVEGGSAHYFSDIQHWTAFFFIAYYSGYWFQNTKKVSRTLIYTASLLLLALCTFNSLYSFERLLKDNYITKQNLLRPKIFDVDLITTRELINNGSTLFNPELRTRLHANKDFNKLKSLISLDTLSNKKNLLLYIEDETSLSEYLPCYKLPFFMTGTTGIALLNGFSLKDCFWGGYSVEYYQENRNISKDQHLCSLVENKIFKGIISYNIIEQTYETINCQ